MTLIRPLLEASHILNVSVADQTVQFLNAVRELIGYHCVNAIEDREELGGFGYDSIRSVGVTSCCEAFFRQGDIDKSDVQDQEIC